MESEIFRIFLQHVVVNVYKISNHSDVVMFLARWNGMECLIHQSINTTYVCMSQITYNSVDIAQISQLSSICNSVSIGYLDILHLLRDLYTSTHSLNLTNLSVPLCVNTRSRGSKIFCDHLIQLVHTHVKCQYSPRTQCVVRGWDSKVLV